MLAEKNLISPLINAKTTSKCALFVSNLLDIPVDFIIMMALKADGLNFNSLSVAKLKDIIRHLKSHYIECQNLSVSLNKPQLINSIENIIASELNQKLVLSEINCMNSFKANNTDSSCNSKVHIMNINENNLIPKKVDSRNTTTINNNVPNVNTIIEQQRNTIVINNKTQSNHFENKYANINSSTSININNHLNFRSIVDSNQKEQIYQELINYQGITKEEILNEISHIFKTTTATLPNHLINSDMVLLSIIEKRQPPEINAEERQRQLNEQENKDLDFAIRESENERDVIQERKRQRINELKESKVVLFVDADEYKSSILLSSERLQRHLLNEKVPMKYTYPGNNKHESSDVAIYNCISLSSISSSSLFLHLINQMSDFNIERDALNSGSSLVKFIVLMLDLITINSQQSSGGIHQLLSKNNIFTLYGCSNVELIQWNENSGILYQLDSLRVILTNLLLLENEAIKFYPKMSIPYLFTMAKRIDMKLIKSTLQEVLTSNYVTSKLTKITTRDINRANYIYQLTIKNKSIFINHNAIYDVIEREIHRFQRGLYKLPEDGKLVPAIFRTSKFSVITNLLHNNNNSCDNDDVEVLVDPAIITKQPVISLSCDINNTHKDYYHSDTSSKLSSCCDDYDSEDD